MPARPLPEKFLVAFSLAGEQRELVRTIAEEVEKKLGHGKVFLDEWFEAHLAGSGGDLKLQKIYSEDCALVVYCVSNEYGTKPWTQVEHDAIRARHMKARGSTDKREQHSLLPVRVGEGEIEGILYNAIVPDVRNRSAQETAILIVDRLRLVDPNLFIEGESPQALPDWLGSPPHLSWPMADHSGARDAFAQLLTVNNPKRFLPLRGASETGKSHISRQILANTLALPAIACGRFDFKGTTDMDREVRAFVQELGISTPPANQRLHERLDHILSALRQRAQPTLLIFDTYEMVGETQEWVENQLLPSLIRATWLRVVITGQKVPESAGAVWEAIAHPTIILEPPPPRDWFDYAKQHKPDLTLAQVEIACQLAAHRCGLLNQLLGPVR